MLILQRFHTRNPCKTLAETNYNPAVGWDNTTHQNSVGVNSLYFNDFYSSLLGGLVGNDAHPTAFIFQKIGFAGVSNGKNNGFAGVCRKGLKLLYLKNIKR